MAALPVEIGTVGSTTFGAYGLAAGVGVGLVGIRVFVFMGHAI
jgi:hypothetical protein